MMKITINFRVFFLNSFLPLFLNHSLDLKKRLYLGPTSLDPSLAMIMANMGGVRKGHLAFDPFAGTASILVALAHFGMRILIIYWVCVQRSFIPYHNYVSTFKDWLFAAHGNNKNVLMLIGPIIVQLVRYR